MQTVTLYEMTSLISAAVEVLRQSPTDIIVVYGDCQIEMHRPCEGEPYLCKLGDLQFMTSGDPERPLPTFRPLSEVVIDLAAHRQYRKVA